VLAAAAVDAAVRPWAVEAVVLVVVRPSLAALWVTTLGLLLASSIANVWCCRRTCCCGLCCCCCPRRCCACTSMCRCFLPSCHTRRVDACVEDAAQVDFAALTAQHSGLCIHVMHSSLDALQLLLAGKIHLHMPGTKWMGGGQVLDGK
jgi:hypothetical protein